MSTGIDQKESHFGVVSGTIEVAGQQRPFYCHNTQLSLEALRDIYGGRTYFILPFIDNVRTIVDIGANVGASTIYFAMNYPQARILAFEPFPESYELLARNIQNMPNIIAFDYGLFDQDKQADLHLGLQDSLQGSIGACAEVSADKKVTVSLRDAKTVFVEQNVEEIDILILDTEGCELPILRSIADLFSRVGVFYVEFHHEADRLEIDRMLRPTHLLVKGNISGPDRGELCYALRKRIPDRINALGISL